MTSGDDRQLHNKCFDIPCPDLKNLTMPGWLILPIWSTFSDRQSRGDFQFGHAAASFDGLRFADQSLSLGHDLGLNC